MFFYEGLACPVCGQTFRETDDIVACPQCGAPHHRECWMREGHCHFVADHGTERQWTRPAQASPAGAPAGASAASTGAAAQSAGKACPNCGNVNPQFAEFCSRCGAELPSTDWRSPPPPPQRNVPPTAGPAYPPYGYGEYTPYHNVPVIDPFGGVAHDEVIEDVSAQDLVTITGSNSAYYLPKFYRMSHGGSKLSWNWAAFLLAPFWLLFRKNYLAGVLSLILFSAETMIYQYVMYFLIGPALGSEATYTALLEAVREGRFNTYVWIILLCSLTGLLIRVLVGLMGNALYMRTCLSRVKKLRRDRPDTYQQELMAAGGTSFMLGAVGYAILQFSSMILLFL